MTSALFAAQQAVMQKLANDAGIQAAFGTTPRLYDHVPADPVFPFVVYGQTHVEPLDDKSSSGLRQTILINIWSRYRGGKETRAIFAAVYDALHRADLALDGQEYLACSFASADFGLDDDGLTSFAHARFTLDSRSL